MTYGIHVEAENRQIQVSYKLSPHSYEYITKPVLDRGGMITFLF